MNLAKRDCLVAIAVGLAVLIVYVMTLAPTVLPGDSGEFQLAAPLLGLVHPTGYPLYLLLGKLWTVFVPLGDMAYRMNLLSAVFSASAVACLFLLARQLQLGIVPSAIAALALAFSPTFWSQAVRAEVYALNSLLTVSLFLLALAYHADRLSLPHTLPSTSSVSTRQHGVRSATGAYVLPFVLGLAVFAHHRMAALLIPALVILVARISHPASRIPYPASRISHLVSRLLPVGVFLIPALLNLYIPLRAPVTPCLRLAVGGGPELVVFQNTLADFVAEISGSVFRGSLQLPVAGWAGRLAMAWHLLEEQFGIVGIALAVVGLVVLVWREPRVAIGLILAYVAVVGFCLVYYIGDIADLFTPSYIVVALWIGAGMDVVVRTIRPSWLRVAVFVLAVLWPLSLLVGNWQSLDMSGRTETRTDWESLLSQPLPEGAILVSNDRDEMTPMWYLQHVEGIRRDLVGLFPKITPSADFENIGSLLDWLLARGQKPYLIKPMPGLEVKYLVQTDGSLPQVTGYAVPPSLQPGRPSALSLGGVVRLVGADVDEHISAGGTLTVTLYWTPLATMTENYHSFVQVMTSGGERIAGSDHRPGDVFYPTTMWAVGDLIVDRHAIMLPSSLSPGRYSLHAGMYSYPSLARLAVTGGTQTTIDLGTLEVR